MSPNTTPSAPTTTASRTGRRTLRPPVAGASSVVVVFRFVTIFSQGRAAPARRYRPWTIFTRRAAGPVHQDRGTPGRLSGRSPRARPVRLGVVAALALRDVAVDVVGVVQCLREQAADVVVRGRVVDERALAAALD